jgi:hypothetical protein
MFDPGFSGFTLRSPTSEIIDPSIRKIGKIASGMWCPRCKSPRIQRGYNDAVIFLRLAGWQELLCNNCGLEFKGLDPFGKLERAPSKRREARGNRRRAPRYKVHLPATISMVEGNHLTGKVSYTRSSRGHCETISQMGMALSFVGTRFSEAELSRRGCLLSVTVQLPNGPIDAVVSIVTCDRPGRERGKAKWLLGVTIYQISDKDSDELIAYLSKRSAKEPYLALE